MTVDLSRYYRVLTRDTDRPDWQYIAQYYNPLHWMDLSIIQKGSMLRRLLYIAVYTLFVTRQVLTTDVTDSINYCKLT